MNNGPNTPRSYAPPPVQAPPHRGYDQPPRKNSNKLVIILVLLIVGLPVLLVVLGAVGFFFLAVSGGSSMHEATPPVAQVEVTQPVSAHDVLQTEQWRCTRVIDGNTIEVEHASDSEWVERVRLLCVDTPKKGQPGYAKATQALEKLVLGQQIITELDPKHDSRDGYDRILAYVILELPEEVGVPGSGGYPNVNVEMVKLGHTTYFTKAGASSLFDAEFKAAMAEN